MQDQIIITQKHFWPVKTDQISFAKFKIYNAFDFTIESHNLVVAVQYTSPGLSPIELNRIFF